MIQRRPINIYKNLKGECQGDGVRQWCVFHGIGQEAKAETNAEDVTARHEEELLYSAGDWNKLIKEVVESPSVEIFENHLDTIPCKVL